MNTPALIRGAAWWSAVLAAAGAASAATVHTVDDVTVVGEVVSITDGQLIVSAPATTRPATRPTAIALDDVADVVWRAPTPPKAAPPPAARPAPHRSGGLFSALVQAVDGGDDPASDDASDEPPPQAVAVAVPVSTPATPFQWQVVLAGGDRLHGKVERWAGGTLDLRRVMTDATTLSIPADRLTALWTVSDAAAQAKARAAIADAGTDDVALVRKDAGAVVAVTGTALGVDGDALRFRYDGRDRRLAMAKLVGVVFARRGPTTGPATRPGPRFTARLGEGDAISGTWVGLGADGITLRTDWGAAVKLATSDLLRVQADGGRRAYLSDLTPVAVEQVPYFGRLVPYRVDRSLGGGPIRLSDGTHDKGLAVHARCRLEYDLGGGFDRFRTSVGFEQPDAAAGRAAVRVLADGRPVYDAPDARGDRPAVPLDLDVAGVRRLVLLVDFGPGQGVQARVDWADARLLRRRPASRPAAAEVRP